MGVVEIGAALEEGLVGFFRFVEGEDSGVECVEEVEEEEEEYDKPFHLTLCFVK